jgi:ribosomal-protein-alanine N-acetyltransferase
MLKSSSTPIYLRKLTALDSTPAYASWLNDPEVTRYLETRHSTHSVETCKEFIEAMNGSDTNHLFGIFEADSDRHVGNIKLGFIDHRYETAQLSLFIGEKAAWGFGYATEAIRLVTGFGFADLGLARIEAGCYEENLGSLRAFLKAGYTVEGFFRKKVVLGGRRMGSFWLGILKNECQYDRV